MTEITSLAGVNTLTHVKEKKMRLLLTRLLFSRDRPHGYSVIIHVTMQLFVFFFEVFRVQNQEKQHTADTGAPKAGAGRTKKGRTMSALVSTNFAAAWAHCNVR